MATLSKRPLKIVFCYAHEDEFLLNRLKAHLRPLQRQRLIEMWHDREINAGIEWKKEIDNAFNTADIILLLVSVDFINSEYCYDVELQKAMERHRHEEVCVIPIILRPTSWQGIFGELQALPTDGKPIESTNWYNLDTALYNVVEGIQKVLEHFTPKSPPHFSADFFQERSTNSTKESPFQAEEQSFSQTEFPVSQTTLALLLGASEWPYESLLQSSRAFSSAAHAFENYLLDPSWFGLPSANLLNLFNSGLNAYDMVREIEAFLNTRSPEIKKSDHTANYLLVYYVGHGIYDKDRDFALAIRGTRMKSLTLSGLPLKVFASTLGESARKLRQILILDCAFAGEAFQYFRRTSREGTAILCSSSEITPSVILPDESCTMFTDALLRALSAKNTTIQEARSLRIIGSLTQNILLDMYGKDTPRPQIHSPNQQKIDVADCPFFP